MCGINLGIHTVHQGEGIHSEVNSARLGEIESLWFSSFPHNTDIYDFDSHQVKKQC